MLGASSAGSRTLERDGVVAAIVPACPSARSATRSATETPSARRPRSSELAAAYEEAGVARVDRLGARSSTARRSTLLEAAGHVLDGTPTAMSLELAGFEPPEVGDLDWDTDADPPDSGASTTSPTGCRGTRGIAPGLAARPRAATCASTRPASTASRLRARDDRPRPRPRLLLRRHRIPDHRGHGLARRLITVAIAEARDRGLGPPRCRARRWASRSTSGSATARLRARMYERRR